MRWKTCGGMMRKLLQQVIAAISISALSGCAVGVPHMGDIGVTPDERIANEEDLVSHIQCELHLAFQRVHDDVAYSHGATKPGQPVGNTIDWLDKWGAKVTLEFQVQAKSSFTPSLSIAQPLQNALRVFPENGNVPIARSHGGKFGASISSDVTRTENISYFYLFDNWVNHNPLDKPEVRRLGPDWIAGQAPPEPILDKVCKKSNFAPDDDLQIYDWLHSKIRLAGHPGLLGEKPDDAPFSSLSLDIHFIITKSFDVAPVFKLVTVGINSDSKFYSGSRAKSDHLIITLGKPDPAKPDQPSEEVSQQHFARLIGQSVADAIKGN